MHENGNSAGCLVSHFFISFYPDSYALCTASCRTNQKPKIIWFLKCVHFEDVNNDLCLFMIREGWKDLGKNIKILFYILSFKPCLCLVGCLFARPIPIHLYRVPAAITSPVTSASLSFASFCIDEHVKNSAVT